MEPGGLTRYLSIIYIANEVLLIELQAQLLRRILIEMESSISKPTTIGQDIKDHPLKRIWA